MVWSSELAAATVLPMAAQLRKQQRGHSREHHLHLHPGAFHPPSLSRHPETTGGTVRAQHPWVQHPWVPFACQQVTARDVAQLPAPGARELCPNSARERARPGPGGDNSSATRSPELMSSRLFPSLLCTRHAPCEPFLRGIRTKGSWEYLSGTGESGDAAGGTLLPSPRAASP